MVYRADALETLLNRKVITRRMATAADMWAADREAGEPGSGRASIAYRTRTVGATTGLDMRAVARSRWRAARDRLQEFTQVCEAVVFKGQSPTAWATAAGKPPQVGAEFLRLGLTRLANFYEVGEPE